MTQIRPSSGYLVVEKSLPPDKVVVLKSGRFGPFIVEERDKDWGEFIRVKAPSDKEQELVKFLKENLKPEGWYADSMGTTNKVVFPGRAFNVRNAQEAAKAQAFGKGLGIPSGQLDFYKSAADLEHEGSQTFEDETGTYDVNIKKLWDVVKDNPAREVDVQTLFAELRKRGWKFSEKSPSISRVDVSFPIILDESGDLVDGAHRIMKAAGLGMEKIKAVTVSSDQIKAASTKIAEPLEKKAKEDFYKSAAVIGHITGPSGAGKTTLLRQLKAKHPNLVVKDIDEFHDIVRAKHKVLPDPDEYDTLLEKELKKFLNKHKSDPVLLGGSKSKFAPTMGVGEGQKWLLNVGALRSAWRRYRRPNERPWVGPIGERLGTLREIPGVYLSNRRMIKRALERGYERKSPEEIMQLVEESLGKTSASKKEQERKLHILIKKLTHEGIPAEKYSMKESRRVLGHAILREPIKDKRKYKFLRELYTKPEYRRQGVARKLVEKMREDYPKKGIIFVVDPFKDKPLTKEQLKVMYRKLGAKKHPSTKYERMVFKPLEKAASFSGGFLDELYKIARTMEEGINRFEGMGARLQTDGGGLLRGDQFEPPVLKEPQSEPSPRKPLENKRSQTHHHK